MLPSSDQQPTPIPSDNPIPAQLYSTRNYHLLPKDKHDLPAIAHLHTLDPTHWIGLTTLQHPAHYSLLSWTADPNWPICQPTCELLLTLVNIPQNRLAYGDVFVSAVRRVLEESDEWDWVHVVITSSVDGIEDKEWMRREFGGTLRALKGRVPVEEWEAWEFGEVVGRCLGEQEAEKS